MSPTVECAPHGSYLAPTGTFAGAFSTCACLNSSSRTSESVGCACTLNLMSSTVCLVAIALDASWMRSAACRPMMCTPRISPVPLLYIILARPSPSFSASALELALNDVLTMPSGNPCSLAISSAFSWVTPTNETSGCVKHAAGIELWFSTCGRPSMFSIAEMPCALAACASMYLPLASPMQYTFGTTLPSLPSTSIFSETGTKPRRSVSALIAPRLSPWVKGARPVATMHASTSSVSTTFLVLKSVSSIVTGLTPGTPGVTLVAITPVW
mmetsp:Transcript_32029/g.95682  ORF Transcript_32029/g.95682 Transcript_32029/m.95682 type:complete len:270 (-) Transcript_32029:1017-1826(-)